ncbi:hypothetical protein [Marinobacter sp.]|uniref:hypothetical protein n=1 Tax=Marinobacter sp. TaxID=50741 RepID=UPI003566F376
MERTSPSMSYSDLQNTLDEGFAEQRHRDLWLFLYSSRHAHIQLHHPDAHKSLCIRKSNQLIDDTYLLLEKFAPAETMALRPTSEKLAVLFFRFCFGITYAFHRRHFADGFIDIRFEAQLARYNAFINKLTRDQIAVVSQLHDLTHKYGFLITELWLPLVSSKSLMETFVIKNLEIKDIAPIPSFTFTKKQSHLQGIQISKKEHQNKITKSWDLVIFINENDKLSDIKEKVSGCWKLSENQVIGDHKNHNIAFYVGRKQCSIRNLLDTIKLQIDQLNSYNNGLSLIAEPEDLGGFNKNKAKASKETKRNLSSTIDRLRLSEGLIYKRWSVGQSNVRRSVGLYLWDQKNIETPSRSRKSIIRDLIDKLKRQQPEALEFYFKNFNKYDSPAQTTKFGDSAGALETVTREMEADFDLTDNCIRNFEFLTPQDVKSRRRKS